MTPRATRTCSSARSESPRSSASKASSDCETTRMLRMPIWMHAVDASSNRSRASSTSPKHEVGFGEQPQGVGPPRTPWRLLGQCQCRIGQHRLGAVRAHHRSQHRLGGLERGGTIPRWQVERGGVDHRRPTLRPHGVAREHARRAGVHRQRRPGRDRLVAQGGEPALDRRQPAGVEERIRQLGRQLRRAGAAPRFSAGARPPSPATRWTRTSPPPAGAGRRPCRVRGDEARPAGTPGTSA